MNKFSKVFTALLAVVLSTLYVQPANAGELATGGSTITWDEGTFYYPSSCSSFVFKYTNGAKVNFGVIKVKNKFGDSLGSEMTSGAQGSASMQICSSGATAETAPFTVQFEVKQKYSEGGDGSASLVSAPLVFQQRNATPPKTQTPQPSVAPSAPAQTPTTGNAIYVCINKKQFTVKRTIAKYCSSGWVLKSFRY
jgi:hypothetical protein